MLHARPGQTGKGREPLPESCYIPLVREILRKHPRFFLAATLAAIALRLLFVLRFPAITSDSFVYGDIARNWLQHGIYGLGGGTEITPTCIRLPGYPAFLAAVFAIFGVEHYRAAMIIQVFVDLATCFLIADLARRLVSNRAGKVAFLLAALCPFLANYTAAVLTESWEIFFTALALDLALVALEGGQTSIAWLGCGLSTGATILLRPDGGLLLIAIEVYLLMQISGAAGLNRMRAAPLFKAAVIVLLLAIVPLVPWTVRNLHTLHRFEPLVPRYANDKDTFVPTGFIRWLKTWTLDYVSVEEVEWMVPGSTIDADSLPTRAFDSPQQQDQTGELLDDYNRLLRVSPDLDARFASLAAERIHHAPLRYYLFLPLGRVADMWLRPRTELLPCNTRWWEFDEPPQWLALSLAIGLLNLLYVAAAFGGLLRGNLRAGFGLLLLFVLLRTVFLGTLENPEPRYTLECYPAVILLAASFFAGERSFPKANPRSHLPN